MKPFLVVGSSGRVGRLVTKFWKNDPDTFESMILQSRCSSTNTCESSLYWDPQQGSSALCDWVVRYGSINTMVVLAGVVPRTGEDFSANTRIADSCIGAALDAGIQRVLIASSSAVYGSSLGTPFSEKSICRPVNAYGASKLEMERFCCRWRERDLELCFLRIGNVAGADSLLMKIEELSLSEPVIIDTFSDGTSPERSYIGPKTLAKVLKSLFISQKRLPYTLNVAAPKSVSMVSLSEAIKHPWKARHSNGSNHRILLNCDLLEEFHNFSEEDSLPFEMIKQISEAK